MMWWSGVVVKDILREERLSEPTQKCRPVFHNRVSVNPHDYLERSKGSCWYRAFLDVLCPQIECHVAISTQDHVELAGSTRPQGIEGKQNGTGRDAARKYIVRKTGRSCKPQLRIIPPEIAAQQSPILAVSGVAAEHASAMVRPENPVFDCSLTHSRCALLHFQKAVAEGLAPDRRFAY